MSMYNTCPHVHQLASFTLDDIVGRTTCQVCAIGGPNLWVCVTESCHLFTGCGEGISDHSTQHFQLNPSHRLTLNSTTFRIWCYECQTEIFLDNDKNNDNQPIDTTNDSDKSKPILANQVYVADITDDETTDEEELFIDPQSKPRGLTGLQNLGNSCYMNAALQSLSNCPQLTRFMLDCQSYIRRPGLARTYCRLMKEIWDNRRPSYVVPTGIMHGIKSVFPLFRGYTQQDAQEFLRCFLDQLHEELKDSHFTDIQCLAHGNQFYVNTFTKSCGNSGDFASNEVHINGINTDSETDSDDDYETCDSGLSSEKSTFGGEDESDGNIVNNEDMAVETSSPSAVEDKHQDQSPSPTMGSSISSLATQTTVNGPVPRNMIDPYGTGGQSTSSSPTQSTPKKQSTDKSRTRITKYRSIISDIFDGRILSSVQCLKCDNISTTRETFQDLSLPIPSREQLIMLRQQQQQLSHLHNMNHPFGADNQQMASIIDMTKDNVNGIYSWFWEWVDWLMAWILGPTITLQDCLSAFFSADELRGDNMYSCEKCKKLRNGVKYSKVLQLPEILSIHLKRFRHELMYSSKISSHVTFPLEGLDMSPYIAAEPERPSVGTTVYDLVAVICHIGTAASGHYTAYALNQYNQIWYEYDDQYVTSVDAQQVANCDAYVLFYRKSNDEMNKRRIRALELMRLSRSEPSPLQFYVSKQWVNRFNTFADPGPITNCDFLCHHNAVDPQKANIVHDLCTIFSHSVWEYFQMSFGGGPPCTQLYVCQTCLADRDRDRDGSDRRRRTKSSRLQSVSHDSNE